MSWRAADFTKAVSVAPQSEKAYLGRADVLESDGQPEQALNDCQNAVRINPNSAAGYLCRAESYLKMKLAERAVEDVNRAVVTAQTFNQPLPLGGALAQALQESVSAPVSAAVAVRQCPCRWRRSLWWHRFRSRRSRQRFRRSLPYRKW